MARSINAIGMPAIESCPDCDGMALVGTTVSVDSTDITLDGSGGVAQWWDDAHWESLVISLECRDCNPVLVEDGEIVHDEVA